MRHKIGITIGDPAGIGPEVALKALHNRCIYDLAIPILIGDRVALEQTADILNIPNSQLTEISTPFQAQGIYGQYEYINLDKLKRGEYQQGKVAACCGEAAFSYIERAISLALNQQLSAIVTAPINKEAVQLAGYSFPGHTEILAHYCNVDDFAMVLIASNLRVIHVTTHMSMQQVCTTLSIERVYDTIRLADETCRNMGVNGTIAVAGFNPHASENSLFGDEEAKFIIPAVEKAQGEGIDVEGPIPADTVFAKALGGRYTMVVAIYHDQGHIPVKLAGFKYDEQTGNFNEVGGINCTVGLPIIRTSVDHGTAFDIAGKGIANDQSMTDAILLAAIMAEKREDTNAD